MILITGSSGFLGTNVTEYFVSKKEQVVGLDLAGPQRKFDKEIFTFMKCDLTDKKSVNEIFKRFKPEYVINLAFVTHRKEIYREFLDDVRITLNALESAAKNDVQRIILMSSSTVYGLRDVDKPVEEEEKPDPKGTYGKAKLMAELMGRQYLESENLRVVIIRGFEIYGPCLTIPSIVGKLLKRAVKGEKLQIYCYGMQKTDFTFAEDVAGAMELLLHDSRAIGEVFDVGSGKPYTYKDLGDVIKKLLPCEIELLPPRPNEKPFYLYSTVAKLKSLGFNPKYDLEEGMKIAADWMLANYG